MDSLALSAQPNVGQDGRSWFWALVSLVSLSGDMFLTCNTHARRHLEI